MSRKAPTESASRARDAGSKSKRSAAKGVGDVISVRGCRVHNLQSVDLDLPRGKLIAFCGLSGSGKTSLALDTLYAEGQRAYIESFSAYTRQFLERLDKPDCESIEGIPPAVAVTRAGGIRTNRSTVGTATEVADHLRLVFARCATLYCTGCGAFVTADDPEEIAADLASESRRAMIGFPVWLPDRKAGGEILMGLQQEGYLRLLVGEQTHHLSDADRPSLAKKIGRKGVECVVIVDRVGGAAEVTRLTESLELAMGEGHGRAVILEEVLAEDLDGAVVQPSGSQSPTSASAAQADGDVADGDVAQGAAAEADRDASSDRERRPGRIVQVDGGAWRRRTISDQRRCDECDLDYPDPTARLFNFNHPLGACERCEGFGELVDYDMDLVVPDPSVSLAEGAIAPWTTPSYSHELEELLELADDYGIPVDVPFSKLKAKQLKLIRQGVPEREFGGLNGFFAWLERRKYKMHIRVFSSRYKSYRTCEGCDGKRFNPQALAYRLGHATVSDVLKMPAGEAGDFFRSLDLADREQEIAAEPLRQVLDRIGYLETVGLSDLQLDRPLRTLSGGETQRVALTSALGGDLVNLLYVLDEPTAGLHASDVRRLTTAICALRDRGNTVIVVEPIRT